MWGVPAIFIYLIAEIGVANLFINFVSQPSIGNMTHEAAVKYLTMMWGGMMVGRFAGAFIMRRFAADKVLAAFAFAAFVVMIAAASLARADCDVGADPGRAVPFDHVPDDLCAGDQRLGAADRGRLWPADYRDCRWCFGGGAGLAGGSVRPAEQLLVDRGVRTLCVLVCFVGQQADGGIATRSLGMTPRLVWPVAAELGEGPVWLPREGALRFVDIKRGLLHRFVPETGARETLDVGGLPSFILPASGRRVDRRITRHGCTGWKAISLGP